MVPGLWLIIAVWIIPEFSTHRFSIRVTHYSRQTRICHFYIPTSTRAGKTY